MIKLKQLSLIMCSSASMTAMATDFEFDRPGTGFSTGITPVGHLAWEQGLPTVQYKETLGQHISDKTIQLNADVLLRTGIAKNTELQLGWDGPVWESNRLNGQTKDESGLGDVSIGIKHRIDLDDEKLKLAVLAQATIATGNEQFSIDKNIYTLASSVFYQQNDLVDTGISMFYSIQDRDLSVTAVPTINYKIAGNLSGFSEAVFTKTESQAFEYGLGTGLVYKISDRAQIDASVGVDLHERGRSYKGGLGLAFLF